MKNLKLKQLIESAKGNKKVLLGLVAVCAIVLGTAGVAVSQFTREEPSKEIQSNVAVEVNNDEQELKILSEDFNNIKVENMNEAEESEFNNIKSNFDIAINEKNIENAKAEYSKLEDLKVRVDNRIKEESNQEDAIKCPVGEVQNEQPIETPKQEEVVKTPVETKPVQEPVETKPVQQPVQTKPAESKPVQNKPVVNTPVETKPVHTHTWVEKFKDVYHEAQGHYEKVCIKQPWTESIPVYEERDRAICNTCSADITDNITAHGKNHLLNGENDSYRVEWINVQVGTNTIKHDGVYEDKWVVDKEAWTEKVSIGHSCSCGATK